MLLEAEVMKEFPDWQPGENVYRTVDWMPPLPSPEEIFFQGMFLFVICFDMLFVMLMLT